MRRKHGHDEHCRELHRALKRAKSAMRSTTVGDTFLPDSPTAVTEIREAQDVSAAAEIARIEQTLREHGCTL
jgi:hypothetical protein